MRRLITDQRGFSTVELLVAMQVMALVAGLAFGYFLFIRTFHRKWEDRNRLQITAVTDMEHLAGTIRNAERINRAGVNVLEVTDANGIERAYTLNGGRLYAGAMCLTPDPVRIDGLHFTCRSRSSALDDNLDGTVDERELDRKGDGRLDAEEAQTVHMIDIAITYRSGHDEFSVSQSVMLRNPGALL